MWQLHTSCEKGYFFPNLRELQTCCFFHGSLNGFQHQSPKLVIPWWSHHMIFHKMDIIGQSLFYAIMLDSIFILTNISLLSLPVPAGVSVPPSISPRQDSDSQSSPHGLYHSDDSEDDDHDDDDSDSKKDDDSDEGGAGSPSVSSASDSSRSPARPGVCFCGTILCVSVRVKHSQTDSVHFEVLNPRMVGWKFVFHSFADISCSLISTRIPALSCPFLFHLVRIPNAEAIRAAKRQRHAVRSQREYISLGRDGQSSAGSTPDHHSRDDDEERVHDDDDEPDDHERRIEFAPRLKSIRERIAEKIGMWGREKGDD